MYWLADSAAEHRTVEWVVNVDGGWAGSRPE